MGHDAGGAAAEEGVEDQVALVGGSADDALEVDLDLIARMVAAARKPPVAPGVDPRAVLEGFATYMLQQIPAYLETRK